MFNNYENIVELILDVLSKDDNRVFIIDEGKEITRKEFLILSFKIYSHIPKGKVLINLKSKSLTVAAYNACLFKGSLPFIRDAYIEKSPLDKYQYDFVIDENNVHDFINSESYEEYKYHQGDIDPKSPCLALISSGTSKDNKVIVLPHRAVLLNCFDALTILGIVKGWRYINIAPLTHAIGMISDYICILLIEGSIVYTYSVFEYLSSLKRYEPDATHTTSNMCDAIYMLFEQNGKENTDKNLKAIIVGGSKPNKDIAYKFEKYGVSVCSCYGLSECCPVVSISPIKGARNPSDGYILPIHNVEIAEDGEIVVKGESIMLNYLEGYLKGEVVKEVRTKDVGYIKDGCLYVVGRKDNLIIMANGEKIQPESFEEEINKNPHVKESIIYQKNGALYLDVVMNDQYDLAKDLTKYDIHINYVNELKKNALGKLDRKWYKQ